MKISEIVNEAFTGKPCRETPSLVGEKYTGHRQPTLERLREFKDDPTIFVSFTELPKLGLNPRTTYGTPAGVYAYPLRDAWERYRLEQRGMIGFPFAERQPYVWVFRGHGVIALDELTAQDVKSFQRALTESGHDSTPLDPLMTREYPEPWKLGRAFFNFTNDLSNGSRNPVRWNKIFCDAGIPAIKDNSAIIHANEPCQAVFFDVRAIRPIEMLRNTHTEKQRPRVDKIQ